MHSENFKADFLKMASTTFRNTSNLKTIGVEMWFKF